MKGYQYWKDALRFSNLTAYLVFEWPLLIAHQAYSVSAWRLFIPEHLSPAQIVHHTQGVLIFKALSHAELKFKDRCWKTQDESHLTSILKFVNYLRCCQPCHTYLPPHSTIYWVHALSDYWRQGSTGSGLGSYLCTLGSVGQYLKMAQPSDHCLHGSQDLAFLWLPPKCFQNMF